MIFFTGCDNSAPTTAARPEKKPHRVEAHIVTTRELGITQVRTGTLTARRYVRLHNQEAGRIELLPFYEGDPVQQGELLVQLDDRLLKAQIAKAEAQLHQAQQDLARIKRLSKKNLVSQDEQVRALTAAEVADSEVRLLKTRLSYTRLQAPFDGVITQRLAEPGDAVPAYAHILSVADPASLITELNVSELLLSQLSINDQVQVRIDALGATDFPGRIHRIHPTINPMTRQGVIEIRLDPVPAGAKAGQLSRVSIASRPSPRRVIPLQSLRRDKQGEYVYLLDNHVAQRRAVRTGATFDQWIEILEGLEERDLIVVRGFLGLADGSIVTIVNPADVNADG